MKTIIMILSLVLLAACTSSVKLRHVVTGKVVQCGPYSTVRFNDAMTVPERERGCIQDYERQGYERL